MKKLIIILFLLAIFLLGFKVFKVDNIIDILKTFDEGEKLGLVEVKNIVFERNENYLSGYLDIYVEKENITAFEKFLRDKKIDFIDIKEGNTRIYLKENLKNFISSDFKTIFLLELSNILLSKNFYFILLIAIIFYLLILPNI
ncbi:MAG: hypothetical protein N3D74_01870 [Caldisericia bacterium]|nr:hypothetical protein [Caldisericia bacterium]